MLLCEPTRTAAKSFSLTLAIIQTVERSAIVRVPATTKPRLALRVRTPYYQGLFLGLSCLRLRFDRNCHFCAFLKGDFIS
jgi:hypothetical protein